MSPACKPTIPIYTIQYPVHPSLPNSPSVYWQVQPHERNTMDLHGNPVTWCVLYVLHYLSVALLRLHDQVSSTQFEANPFPSHNRYVGVAITCAYLWSATLRAKTPAKEWNGVKRKRFVQFCECLYLLDFFFLLIGITGIAESFLSGSRPKRCSSVGDPGDPSAISNFLCSVVIFGNAMLGNVWQCFAVKSSTVVLLSVYTRPSHGIGQVMHLITYFFTVMWPDLRNLPSISAIPHWYRLWLWLWETVTLY